MNLFYLYNESDLSGNIEKYGNCSIIKGTSFGLPQKIDLNCSHEIVKAVLENFLSAWEINHRKLLSKKMKAFYEKMEELRVKNMKCLFKVHHSHNAKENIKSFNQIRKEAVSQK